MAAVANMSTDLEQDSDLLDLLFNPGDGILSESDFSDIISGGYLVNEQALYSANVAPNYNPSTHYVRSDSTDNAEALLNCLQDIDFTCTDFPTIDTLPLFDELLEQPTYQSQRLPPNCQFVLNDKDCQLQQGQPPNCQLQQQVELSQYQLQQTTPPHCITDHMYSRLPDEENIHQQFGTSSNDQQISDSFSPGSGGVASDCDTVSCRESRNSLSELEDHSPLGGIIEIEDVMNYADSFDVQGDYQMEERNNCSTLVDLDSDGDSMSDGSGSNEVEHSTSPATSIFDFASSFSRSSSKSSDSNNTGLPFTVNDVQRQTRSGNSDQCLLTLSDEEKMLLAREGITLPTDLPLTKEEERALKAVRRKIRNKVSAKTSRRRKQEYVDGLEKRVKICSVQNKTLQDKVDKLEKQNTSLIEQLKKLRSMISVPQPQQQFLQQFSMNCSNASTTTRIGTGTCIMVLVLSFGLFIAPSLNPFFSTNTQSLQKGVLPGQSRKILHFEVPANGGNKLFTSLPSEILDDLNSDSGPYDPLLGAPAPQNEPASEELNHAYSYLESGHISDIGDNYASDLNITRDPLTNEKEVGQVNVNIENAGKIGGESEEPSYAENSETAPSGALDGGKVELLGRGDNNSEDLGDRNSGNVDYIIKNDL